MSKPLNTIYEFEFQDGSKTGMTLTFYALYQLKTKNPMLYKKYNRIMSAMAKSESDELDSVLLLYVAYVCAHMDEAEVMSEEEFILKCGFDREAIGNAAKALTTAKKR